MLKQSDLYTISHTGIFLSQILNFTRHSHSKGLILVITTFFQGVNKQNDEQTMEIEVLIASAIFYQKSKIFTETKT